MYRILLILLHRYRISAHSTYVIVTDNPDSLVFPLITFPDSASDLRLVESIIICRTVGYNNFICTTICYIISCINSILYNSWIVFQFAFIPDWNIAGHLFLCLFGPDLYATVPSKGFTVTAPPLVYASNVVPSSVG